jgi:predicted esterase
MEHIKYNGEIIKTQFDPVKETIKKASIQVIEALNKMDKNLMDGIPRYNTTDFWINGEGLNYAAMFLQTDWNKFDSTHPIYDWKLDMILVNVIGDSAVSLGHLSGSIIYQDSSVVKGPWRFAFFWIKMGIEWKLEHANICKNNIPKLQYFVQLPKDYEKDIGKNWPLLIYLHGIGERGTKIRAVRALVTRRVAVPKVAAETKNFPFVTITPMCPWGYSWNDITYSFNNFIDEVIAKFRIDTDRIYLTGMSFGGTGVWAYSIQFPERFAAVAPVCGGYIDLSRLECMKGVPAWVFHGQKDIFIPIEIPTNAVNVLKAMGNEVKFTTYPELDHYIWDTTYDNPELYSWFLEHKKARET